MNKRSGIKSKKRILDAAMKVFSDHGYAKANMRMIAKAADISIGGLYLYFKNKDDLCLTLLKSRLDDLSARTKEALGDIEDPSEAIARFISMHINYAKKHMELIIVQGREQGFTFGISVKKKFFIGQRKLLEGIIKDGVEKGVFRKCDVEESAKIIFGAIRGFILSLVVEAGALFSPEECSKLLLNGLIRRDKK